MTISPAFITFRNKESQSVQVAGLSDAKLNVQDVSIVAITKKGNSLIESECTEISSDVVSVTSLGMNTYEIKVDYSQSVFSCNKEKGSYLALKISQTPINKNDIASIPQTFVPIFDYTNALELYAKSGSYVLGSVSDSLQVSALQCQPSFQFAGAESVQCNANITNATQLPVKTNLVFQLIDGLPPYLTSYQDTSKTNLLLLPGESISVNYQVPNDVKTTLLNRATLTSTFSLLGEDLSMHSTKQVATYYVIGWEIVFLLVGILVLFSAILSRLRKNKFITSPHGKHKRQKETS